MSNLYRRNGNIFKANSSDSTDVDFAASYTVTVYSIGAVANGAQSGSQTLTVHAGHGFAVGDKFMVGTTATQFFAVASLTSTTLVTTTGNVTCSDDDLIVNLGADTGSTTPNYDGSKVPIYSDNNGSTAYSNSRLTCDAQGGYSYWYKGSGAAWELIRTGTTNVEVVPGVGTPGSYSVYDFGAKGDGATDDYDEFQAAIDATQGNGDTLYIPPSSSGYKIDSKLTIASSMRLLVDGATVTLPATAGIASGMLVTGSNITIEGRNGGGFAASKDLSVEGANYDVIRIDDSVASVENVRVLGVKIRATVTNTESNVQVSCVRFWALTSGRTMTNPRVENCNLKVTASDVDTLHKWYGIYFYCFQGASDNTRTISGAVAKGNYLDSSAGRNIQMFMVNGGVVEDNVITTLSGTNQFGAAGIRILGCADIVVSGNYVEKGASSYGRLMYFAGSTGYDTEKWCERCTCTGNMFTDNTTANADVVVYIDGCRNLLIESNIIIATDSTGLTNHWGVRVDDATFSDTPNSDVYIVGNHIAGFGGSGGQCIRIDANQTSVTFANNYCVSGPGNSNIFQDVFGSTHIYGNSYDGTLSHHGTLVTLTDDSTPSVSGGTMFVTGGTTTIGDFDDGAIGQQITILSAHAITIVDSTAIILNGSANFVMAAGDTLTLVMFNNQVWQEISRTVNLAP